MGGSILAVAAIGISLLALQRLFPLAARDSWLWRAAGVAGGALALAAAWRWRRRLWRWLVSLPFAVSLLGGLLLATAAGTFVLQGVSAEEFDKRYGKAAGALRLLALDDIFHALPFRGLLALLALALLLVTLRRRFWRVDQWGFALSHAGVIAVLCGGLIWSLWGGKGFIDLHEGQTVAAMRPMEGAGPAMPLGFSVRLDRFEVERHPGEYRLLTYDLRGAKPRLERSRAVAGANPEEWLAAGAAAAEGAAYRVRAVYPDFALQTSLRPPREGETGRTGIALAVENRDGSRRTVTLFAGLEERDSLALTRPQVAVRVVEGPPPAREAPKEKPSPARHVISVGAGGAGAVEEIAVAPGRSYQAAGGALEVGVLAFYPDFLWNGDRGEASSRSTAPNNPALRVRVNGEERWLFANAPDFGAGEEHGGGGEPVALRYRYEPARGPVGREVVIVASTREALDYRDGERASMRPLAAEPGDDQPIADGVPVYFEALHANVVEENRAVNRSNQWRRPMVDVEVRRAGRTERHYLAAGGEPLPLDDARAAVLVFDLSGNDVKSFRSHVTVLDKGAPALASVVAVNDSLFYGGYRFYQSNFRREDPTYSGLLVVWDPGLPVAYAGFVMVALGVAWSFYVRPWLRGRAARAGGATGASGGAGGKEAAV